MKQYEGMFILKPDMDKTNFDKTLAHIQELVAKHKGSVSDTRDMGKNRFAYPIKKYKEGMYYLIKFSITSEAVDSIKKNLVLNESILRMLIVEL